MHLSRSDDCITRSENLGNYHQRSVDPPATDASFGKKSSTFPIPFRINPRTKSQASELHNGSFGYPLLSEHLLM
ncbi:hypothetical protein TNCV_3412321 [Trichonephila clavipes]|uniref:Uncharacterized protein n=1 Tax=Trichonephila clavipes TaxID=2585209 RepID=A0A8X6V5H0_TRICX|nr:hypothetical protein TNCV_3412321 [Trichonephila clavipes]